MNSSLALTPVSRRSLLTAAPAAALAVAVPTSAPAASPLHPGQGMWVGGNRIIDLGKGPRLTDLQTWLAASRAHGPWTVRRTFSPTMDSTIKGTLAQQMVDAGILIHHSVKPPKGVTWRQAMDGRYDDALASLARSMPTKRPTWLTVNHEPEGYVTGLDNEHDDKGTAADFVAFHQHCYRIVKHANRNVQVGPIHMSHQWEPGSPVTARPQAWFVGDEFCDFVAVDAYWSLKKGTPRGMQDYPQFRRFYTWARTAYRHARCGLTEFAYQYDPAHPLARAQAITSTARFLTAEHFFTMQYWDSWNGLGWALDDRGDGAAPGGPGDVAAIKAYRAICANARRH